MKSFAILSAAFVCLVSMVGSAAAAEVSKSTLNGMGLGKLTIMSDADGLAIRGKGTSASVWGSSEANFIGGQHAEDGFSASSSHHHGNSSAVGGSFSVAGVATGHGHCISFIVTGAAGGAFASAK